MKQLKEYIQELEENYNDLSSIYQTGRNETGKNKDQLLYRSPNYAAFKEAFKSNKDSNINARIFRLKNNFRKLLSNQFVAKTIANLIFNNFYNINNYRVNEVTIHLYEQVQKLEYVIESDDTSVEVEVTHHNTGKKVSISKQFISALSELDYDGNLIFEDEIDDKVQFRNKIELLLSKRFNEMKVPLNLKVPNKNKFVAHYIITVLMKQFGLSKKYTPLESVISINGAPFKASARSNSWGKDIQPRLLNKNKDLIFNDLIQHLDSALIFLK